MSVRRLMAMAGGLLIATAAVPRVELHAQLEALRQDSRFIFDAASSNLFEIRAGQLAQSKATNQSVKQFGQQMVTDHTNLHNQLTALVSKNRDFKPGLTDEDEDELERLEDLSGSEFDRSYMTAMVQHHQEDIAEFQKMAQAGRSAEARQIATNGLPVLQGHLNTAVQVSNQIGLNTGVAVSTPQTPPVTTGTPPVSTTQPGTVTTQGTTGDVQADMPFIREASSANMMEIRLGQIAQNKASNSAVKQFGQRMVTDHSNLQNQLNVAASASGQSFTPSMDAEHQSQVNRIERLSGDEFDRVYMSHMIRAHQQDLNEFERQSRSANSSQVRTLATNSLPLLRQHLSLATQVGSQVGADTTTNLAGGDRGDRRGRGNQNVRSDAEFIRDAGAGTTLQIRLAELAKDKARNPEVKRYAERLARDYERIQEQWSELASRNNMGRIETVGPVRGEKIEQLERVSAQNFAQAYMRLMVQQHWDMVSYWRDEGRKAESQQVRSLVNRGLPTIERNFEEAKRLARRVGVNPEEALRNRPDIDRNRGGNSGNRRND